MILFLPILSYVHYAHAGINASCWPMRPLLTSGIHCLSRGGCKVSWHMEWVGICPERPTNWQSNNCCIWIGGHFDHSVSNAVPYSCDLSRDVCLSIYDLLTKCVVCITPVLVASSMLKLLADGHILSTMPATKLGKWPDRHVLPLCFIICKDCHRNESNTVRLFASGEHIPCHICFPVHFKLTDHGDSTHGPPLKTLATTALGLVYCFGVSSAETDSPKSLCVSASLTVPACQGVQRHTTMVGQDDSLHDSRKSCCVMRCCGKSHTQLCCAKVCCT